MINKEAGMSYCGMDDEFYKEILESYLEEADDKKNQLTTALSEKNAKNYEIYVHSLKSGSRTIGADELADYAFELEKAAKAGDLSMAEERQETLFAMYDEVLAEAKKIIEE